MPINKYKKPLYNGTENLDEFLNTLKNRYTDQSEELFEQLKKYIINSNCDKIEFADLRYAEGISLYNGVLINKNVLQMHFKTSLYIILHEIAHQYQFKKYGDSMYDCYMKKMDENDAYKLMVNIEKTADEFAYRKIKEYENKKLLTKHPVINKFYTNLKTEHISHIIKHMRDLIQQQEINNTKKITEMFYNAIKIKLQ